VISYDLTLVDDYKITCRYYQGRSDVGRGQFIMKHASGSMISCDWNYVGDPS